MNPGCNVCPLFWVEKRVSVPTPYTPIRPTYTPIHTTHPNALSASSIYPTLFTPYTLIHLALPLYTPIHKSHHHTPQYKHWLHTPWWTQLTPRIHPNTLSIPSSTLSTAAYTSITVLAPYTQLTPHIHPKTPSIPPYMQLTHTPYTHYHTQHIYL